MSWWSALVFANRLSEKYGLEPVYNLSDVSWIQGTRAENGTLTAFSEKIKINAPGGDYHKAEGFRLLTEDEKMYMLRGTQGHDLKDYAWYHKTHPVALLKPLIVDGKKFYDLYGNVREWVWEDHDPFHQSYGHTSGFRLVKTIH